MTNDRIRCHLVEVDGTKAIGCGPRAATEKDLDAVERFAEFLRHQDPPAPPEPDEEVPGDRRP